ncbi:MULTISPECIES: hypothetical protein [unclassified Prochlorococcus]|uniref:hypothetical protein n=1 Tax=unclassified Prochlorococcus TaxID=2627481 RepID=UPI0005338A4F|nr:MULTISPECIES: hypothetical protein [unclassified Prochlorococcus]KGG15435.1 hypothetical protein EV06_1306 [Prochlorococcus sp. MIT 0602]KGG17714.1 hypothetical protein EV07_1154 [Prochlorococcus sp. MIT 0603]
MEDKFLIRETVKKPKTLAGIIEIGLSYWLKIQCQSIKNLILEIHDLKIGLINHEISSVSLIASDIIFKGLFIDHLKLKSDMIRVSINLIKKNSILSIKDSFIVNAKVTLSQKDINSIITSKDWSSISEWISNNFFNKRRVVDIIVKQSHLIIYSSDTIFNQESLESKKFLLRAIDGNLIFHDKDNSTEKIFPIEKSIYIKDILFNENFLSFFIEAKVKV